MTTDLIDGACQEAVGIDLPVPVMVLIVVAVIAGVVLVARSNRQLATVLCAVPILWFVGGVAFELLWDPEPCN